MKILMASKALVSAAYQVKLEELARLPGVELIAVVPPAWHERGVRMLRLERAHTHGYRLEVLPIAFNGWHHAFFFRGLGRLIARERPAIVHADDESFNPATFLAVRAGVATGARCCFYNYANIARAYPPPFSLFQRYVFQHAHHALVAGREAAALIRRNGYTGPCTILPQFGIDPERFVPGQNGTGRPPIAAEGGSADGGSSGPQAAVAGSGSGSGVPASGLVVGFVGRLIPAKGLYDLLDAAAGLPEVRVRIVGDGPLAGELGRRAESGPLAGRMELAPWVPSDAVPALLRSLDVLVLPSHTTPTWKEQFGRVLIEAMASGVVVVGSSSGEIPTVIGDAGVVFPERDVAALRSCLAQLAGSPSLRAELAARGRARALAHFTHAAVARGYYQVYQQMLA